MADHTKRPIKILVIEDEVEIAELIKHHVEEAGLFVFIPVPLKRESIASFLASTDADVVITDYYMPDINGHDVLATARQFLPRCRVLLVSCFHLIPDADRFDRCFDKIDLLCNRFQPLIDELVDAQKTA